MKITHSFVRRKYRSDLFLLFLLVSCNDDTPLPSREASTDYSFVSIEYTLLAPPSPLRILSYKKYWTNETGSNLIFSCTEDRLNLNSFFDSAQESLPNAESIEVPLPRVDEAGSIVGLTEITFPMTFDKTESRVVVIPYSLAQSVPPYSTCTLSAYNLGWNISTEYACTLIDNVTGKRLVIRGGWRGDVYYRQDSSIKDEQGSTLMQREFPLLY